jgi:spermidine/putrescine transport system substrate-binding protein
MALIKRRTILTGAASVAGVSLASPFVSRRGYAQGTSGSVNIFAWAGYINDEMLAAFTEATASRPTIRPTAPMTNF